MRIVRSDLCWFVRFAAAFFVSCPFTLARAAGDPPPPDAPSITVEEAYYGLPRHACNATGYLKSQCQYVPVPICADAKGNLAGPASADGCGSDHTQIGLDFTPFPKVFCGVKVKLTDMCGGYDPFPGAERRLCVTYHCKKGDMALGARALDGENVYLDCSEQAVEEKTPVPPPCQGWALDSRE
jgi:hypothetical protein